MSWVISGTRRAGNQAPTTASTLMNVNASPAPTSTRAAIASGSAARHGQQQLACRHDQRAYDDQLARPEAVQQHARRHLQARVDQQLEHHEPGQRGGRGVEAGRGVQPGDAERGALHDADHVGREADDPDHPQADSWHGWRGHCGPNGAPSGPGTGCCAGSLTLVLTKGRRCAMLEPAELYELTEADIPAAAPVLIVALDGFVDAGNAARLAVAAISEGQEGRTLARFDVDQLIDYRSRRPPLRFDTDHWASYAAPDLDVVALADTAETEFLLLAGPEPDSQWERFAAAVEQLVERFGVRLVINMSAIPMAVPHTRPIGVTAHGTRRELTEGHEAWFTAADVPGSAVGLMELRLGEAGHDAMGFAVHVPHYLARAEYPQAARVLVDHVGIAAGLYLPTESLSVAAERAEKEIGEQVAASDEVKEVVEALERQYDAVTAGRASGLSDELPSADELAAEVEKFLARHDEDNEPPGP